MDPTQEARLHDDHDFILLKRFDYSLKALLDKHSEGVPDHVIAQALGKTTVWVTKRYAAIVKRLQELVAS
jgi:hypothetical protein